MSAMTRYWTRPLAAKPGAAKGPSFAKPGKLNFARYCLGPVHPTRPS